MRWWDEQVVPRLTDAALKGHEVGELRAEVCIALSGRVVEVGFGGGLNLRFLPDAVTSLDAVEPSDRGWQLSARRRARTELPVARIGLDGQAIEAPDASYDGALCTFTLCTVPDPAAMLSEVRRVVRPGGPVAFLEHGLSTDAPTARWQRRLDPLERRLVGGCHLTRDPAALLRASGMKLQRLDVGRLPGVPGPGPWIFGYRGVATV